MTTKYIHHLLVVIPASYLNRANKLSLDVDPVGGDKTFTVGLSKDGSMPATHYWCSTSATDEGYTKIQGLLELAKSEGTDVIIEDLDKIKSEDVLKRLNIKPIEKFENINRKAERVN